jgi:hypothetical protein
MVPCAMHEKYHCIGVDVFFLQERSSSYYMYMYHFPFRSDAETIP